VVPRGRAVLDVAQDVRLPQIHKIRVGVEALRAHQRLRFPTDLDDTVVDRFVHAKPRVEFDTQENKILAERLVVRKNCHVLLRGVESDLIRNAPSVQLDLAKLQILDDDRFASPKRVLPESVQIVGVHDQLKICETDRPSGVSKESVPQRWAPYSALEDHVRQIHRLRPRAAHKHVCGSISQPRPQDTQNVFV
jgi:hypothetical protein